MGEQERMAVMLADSSQVFSRKVVRMPLKFGSGELQSVSYIVVAKLPCQVILGMPQFRENNPRIDWQLAKVTFMNGFILQAVPCTEKATCPHLLMLSAKQYVREFGKAGQEAWLALIRD